MYTFFEDSNVVKSSENVQELIEARKQHILKLLSQGFEYKSKNIKDDDDIIELTNKNETKKLSILWSNNLVGTHKKLLNISENNNINTDTIEKTVNHRKEINSNEINNNEVDNNEVDNNEINNNEIDNKKDITNQVANKIIDILQSMEYQFLSIPSAFTARQIYNMYNKTNFIQYRNFIFNCILQGKNECIINIPFSQDADLTDVLSFCYMLTLLKYNFELSNDDKQLSIHIKW